MLAAAGLLLLGGVAWWAGPRSPWLSGAAILAVVGICWLMIARARQRLTAAETRAALLATQLDRRISELFSLQELSYVLSESIQMDRIVDQVVRYAARFLQADGAIVVLGNDTPRALEVVAATGSLAALQGHQSHDADAALVRFAIDRERIEVAQGTAASADAQTVNLIDGVRVRSAAVAPLRSQGMTMGALAVADRTGGPFTTEDLWLLSTLATNASVVLANSRLYEIVRQSTEQWETAFHALNEGIAVVGPSGAIQRANRALTEMARVPKPELLGQDFGRVLFDNAPAVVELIAAARQGQRPPPLVADLAETGQELRLTASPLAEPSHPGSIVILVEDVTEQRRMEAQLIQSDKMASIGQLVSGVAHELNNPLTSIAGLAELLLEYHGAPRELPRDHLRVIHEQAERASRIVRNLLTFARKGVPEKAIVDLNDVVTRTSMLIVYELQLHHIELESRLSTDPVLVLGDRHELQQVLLNLVTNAVQAVSGLPPEAQRQVVLSTACVGDHAILTVADNGPGVPPEQASYLFTPFFTTKAPGEGTGLGLSLSYGLIKAHGGVLSYAPAPAGGAEFTVALPLMPDRRATVTEAEAVGAAETAGAKVAGTETAAAPAPATAHVHRILVVDDDTGVHRAVSAVFSGGDYTVETACTGAEGLELATGRRYCAILADAKLATGPEERFVHALLAAAPHSARALIVACATDRDLPERLPPDVCRLRKPLNPRELRARVDERLQSSASDIETKR